MELPRYFVYDFYEELGDTFILRDGYNRIIEVKFNKNMAHSMMAENWLSVRDVFGISGNRLMLFTYIGNNIFFVDVYHEISMGLSRLPSEHSFCRAMEEPKHF
jgi:hypothetical protein